MDQSEIETERRRQIPTLLWLILGALLVVGFAALALLLGRPSSAIGPAPGAAVNAAAQAPPAKVTPPTKLGD